jgi:hypothetical protein
MVKYTPYIQERTELQRVGAKMAALCTPQEVTKPGIYYFEFLFFVVVAIKALLYSVPMFCADHYGL